MKKLLFCFWLLALVLASCSKENELIDQEQNVQLEENDLIVPEAAPNSVFKTSHQNHEWNSGWLSHSDLKSNGGTLDAKLRGSLTYFDYGNDGDWDVFFQEESSAPEWFNTWIVENTGETSGVINWIKRKDVISEILPSGERIPSGGRKMTQADLDNDGDTDFVFFIADDDGFWLSNGGVGNGNPAGGIFAFIYDDGKYTPIEIEPYQGSGNEFFYHGGTLGDINGDGLVDILAGTTKIKIWINQGDLKFIKYEPDIFENSFICSSEIFDINQDGFLDLIVSDGNAFAPYKSSPREFGYIIYGQSEYPFFDNSNITPLIADRDGPSDPNQYDCLFDVSITDLDGDGDYDLFTSAYTIVPNDGMSFLVSYFENNGGEMVNRTKDIFYSDHNEGIINNSGLIKLWDIDNDGSKEILIEASNSDDFPAQTNQKGWDCFKMVDGKFVKGDCNR